MLRWFGLNPLQLVLIGTALEVSTFLLEIPTGVVADVYSRRLSVIIGTALIGVSWMLAGSIPFFVAILLSQFIGGAGHTFLSGAAQAWIADESGETLASKAYMRGAQVGQVCSLIGIVVSTGLAHLQLNLPTIVGGGLFIGLAIFTAFTMPEVGFQPIPQQERTSWKAMGDTFREGGTGRTGAVGVNCHPQHRYLLRDAHRRIRSALGGILTEELYLS